jgi:hypothetical protein
MSRIGTGRSHRSAAALLVASAAIVAACSASHAGDGKADRHLGGGTEGAAVKVEATPAFLARAATRSAAKPYRVRIDMRSSYYGESVTVASGMVAGDAESLSLNYGAMLEVLAGGLGPGSSAPGPLAKDGNLKIDTVSKPPMVYIDLPALVLYMRQPALAEFPRTRGRTADALAPLLDRQASWRRVDVRRLGTATPADVRAVLAGQRLDPTAYLRLLSRVTGEVMEGYPPYTPRGKESGLRAILPLGDVMSVTADDASARRSVGADAYQDVDVIIDRAGYVRNVDYTLRTKAIAAARGENPSRMGALADVEIGYSISMYDYGDRSIPDSLARRTPAYTTDITDTVARLLPGSSPAGPGG